MSKTHLQASKFSHDSQGKRQKGEEGEGKKGKEIA